MGHPDFRIGGKIFATLRAPREGFGMVKLTPDDQERFMSADPKAFVPAAGKWGQRGCTYVELSVAKKNMIKDAVETAWRATAPKRLLKR